MSIPGLTCPDRINDPLKERLKGQVAFLRKGIQPLRDGERIDEKWSVAIKIDIDKI